MRVSVHVCNKDRGTELAQLLQSLQAQVFKEWDLCILDDASGTSPLNLKFVADVINRLRCEGHGVQILRNDVSYGVCYARNKLVREDQWPENELILRLDDDVIIRPTYIQSLMECYEAHKGDGKVLVGGVTPLWCGPDLMRDSKVLNGVASKVTFNGEGDITEMGDDLGVRYTNATATWVKAHHLRSCFLMPRRLFTEDNIWYENGLSRVGFREETFLSLKAAWAGYALWADLGAIAFHQVTPSGGCRDPNYGVFVQDDERKFREWSKKQYKEKGTPRWLQ